MSEGLNGITSSHGPRRPISDSPLAWQQMKRVFFVPLLCLLAIGSGLEKVRAQPVGVTHWSIEARVAAAHQVVFGFIARVSRIPLHEGQWEYRLVLQTTEALKGSPAGVVVGLRPRRLNYEDRRYEQWADARTPCLFFMGPAQEPAGEREWSLLPLGGPVPAENGFTQPPRVPMFSHDFSVIRDNAAVLTRAREFARRFPTPLPNQTLRIPDAIARQGGTVGSWNDLQVPVEPSLEGRARRLIARPGDFMPAGAKLEARSRYHLRAAGVESLRHFRSERNAVLLRGLLDDQPEQFYSVTVEAPLRVRAFRVLLHWRMTTPLPKWPERITRLDMSGTGLVDEGLKQVALLENLDTLELQGTRITPGGLKELRRLQHLTSLRLDDSQLNDTALRVLRETGQLHTLSQATNRAGDAARSLEEVNALALCRTPVTDVGLKELTGMTRLAWLDLRETGVTDAGLRVLVNFSHLRRLLLQDTRVTEAGAAALGRALQDCEISLGE
jgi:hypothetical protein